MWLLQRRGPRRYLPSAAVTEPRCTQTHRHTQIHASTFPTAMQTLVCVCLNQSCSLRDNMQTQDFPSATKLAGICLLLLHPELSTDQEGDRTHSIDLGVSSARLKANSAPAVWHHLGAMLFSSRTYGLAMKTRDSGVAAQPWELPWQQWAGCWLAWWLGKGPGSRLDQ